MSRSDIGRRDIRGVWGVLDEAGDTGVLSVLYKVGVIGVWMVVAVRDC